MASSSSLNPASFLSTKPIKLSTPNFLGHPLLTLNQKPFPLNKLKISIQAQASYCVSKSMRWWEKTLKPNMIEIQSAKELVDTLRNAGDRLVIIAFYSPSCGACKSLHPKMCQLAESNPSAIFLKVNHEELNKMCHALHIHVLPFFKLYKGSQGLLSSFSCTISTICKMKSALAKHSTEGQHRLVGEAKGLSESEVARLAAVGEISMDRNQAAVIIGEEEIDNLFIKAIQNPAPLSLLGAIEDSSLVVV